MGNTQRAPVWSCVGHRAQWVADALWEPPTCSSLVMGGECAVGDPQGCSPPGDSCKSLAGPWVFTISPFRPYQPL